MKKLCVILSAVLCTSLFFSSTSVFADAADDGILTLNEAKELALKNDVQYNLQESYIQDAVENYEELSEDSTKNLTVKGNAAEKAAALISQDVQLENAASGMRKAVLTRADLKRSSDYEAAEAFYEVINAQNSVVNAETDMLIKEKDLEAARTKYRLNIITRNSLSQAETAYTSSETAYNKAVLDLESAVSKLGRSIGEDIDIAETKLDTKLDIPDINSIDLAKIKEDYLKNNLNYFSVKEQYKLAEYELALTGEKCDYYLEYLKSTSSSVGEEFDDMLYDAQKSFDNAEYSYKEKLGDLDETINNQYKNLKDLYESYGNEKDEVEDMKLTVKQDRIKYQMGLIAKAALDSSEASLREKESQLQKTITDLNLQYFSLTQYSSEQ